MLGTILLIILILFLLGALPTRGYSRNWGYGPSGGLGTAADYYPDPGSTGTHLKRV